MNFTCLSGETAHRELFGLVSLLITLQPTEFPGSTYDVHKLTTNSRALLALAVASFGIGTTDIRDHGSDCPTSPTISG